jgi:hypothetical protein
MWGFSLPTAFLPSLAFLMHEDPIAELQGWKEFDGA